MRVKTYVFEEIKSGMEHIREEFGPDTIIVEIKNRENNGTKGGCEISVAVDGDPELDGEGLGQLRRSTEEVWNHATRLLSEKITAMEGELVRDRLKAYPLPLRVLHDKMVKNGFDMRLSLEIVSDVFSEIGNLASDSTKANFFLKTIISGRIKTADFRKSEGHLLLLGPTGAGKTQTAKKLAAILMSEGSPVSLVACEPFKKGSFDELMSFSEKTGVPLSFTTRGDDLPSMIARDDTRKIVDVTGQASVQRHVAEILPSVTRAIVMPAGARDEKIAAYCRHFEGPDLSGIIFTKVDEEETLGHLCHNLVNLDLPLLLMTAGMTVEDAVLPDQDTFCKILLEGNQWKNEDRRQ